TPLRPAPVSDSCAAEPFAMAAGVSPEPVADATVSCPTVRSRVIRRAPREGERLGAAPPVPADAVAACSERVAVPLLEWAAKGLSIPEAEGSSCRVVRRPCFGSATPASEEGAGLTGVAGTPQGTGEGGAGA